MRKQIQRNKNLQKNIVSKELNIQAYLMLTKNQLLPLQFRMQSFLILDKENQKLHVTRKSSFCYATLRGRGSYRIFNLSRAIIKDSINAGLLKGVVNSS